MYKIIFIDDEILIREAVSGNTPWEEAGFQLVGTAENGRDAISLIEKSHPHVVLTDIRMPIMDGLELAKYVHENYDDIKVMILSGHDEFDYAKRALQYGVSEYILKPVMPDELKEELIGMKHKLDEDINEREKVARIQRAYEEKLPALRELYMNRLIEGNGQFADWREQFEHYRMQSPEPFWAICIAAVDDAEAFYRKYPDASRDLVNFAVYNIAHEITEDYPGTYCIQNMRDETLLICNASTQSRLDEIVYGIGERIIYELAKCMDTRMCIVVGRTVRSVTQWSDSYRNAKEAEELRFLMEDSVFLYGNDFANNRTGNSVKTSLYTERLLLSIKINQTDEIEKITKELFAEFREKKPDRKTAFAYIQNMVLSILITLEESELASGEDYEEEISFINRLSDYNHLKDIESEFVAYCLSLAKGIAGKRESINQKQAIMAIDYIEKNYSNSDMSLNMVCAYLSVSTSYFSTIFKACTGETFVEALTRIRIEKAKQLLETTNMKNYEISDAIGINDPHYFSSIFKKQTGMTPGEYSRSVKS